MRSPSYCLRHAKNKNFASLFIKKSLQRLDMCMCSFSCVKSNLHSWGCKIILSFKLLYNIKILLNLVRSSNFELLQLHYHKNRRLVSVLFHLNLSLTHTLRKNGKTYPAGGRWCGFIKSRNLVRKKEGEWYHKFFSNFLLQRSCLEHTRKRFDLNEIFKQSASNLLYFMYKKTHEVIFHFMPIYIFTVWISWLI